MIIVILVALIALTLIGILILQYPMQLQISLIIIEMIVGLIFAAVFAVFVLLRVRTLQSSFISMLIVWAFLFLVGYGMDLKNNPHFNLFSPSAHLIILVIIIDVLLPITFIKFLYYLYRESQKRMYNGCWRKFSTMLHSSTHTYIQATHTIEYAGRVQPHSWGFFCPWMSLSSLTKSPPIASVKPFLKSQTHLPQGIARSAFILAIFSGICKPSGLH